MKDNFQKKFKNKLFTFVRFRKGRHVREPLAFGTGGCNECFKPSNEATIEELREYHREEMGLKKAHRRAWRGL